MLKRTRGVSEFEFLTISDALKEIAENKITRTEERRKRRKKRATDRQDEKDARIAAASSKGGSKKSLSSMRPSATSSAAPSPIRSSSAVGSASSSVAPSIVGSESIDIPRGRAADGGNASTPLDDNLETGSVLWEAATTVVDEPLGEGGVGVNYIPESGVKSVTIGAASKSGAAEPQTSGLTKLLADEGGAEQLDQGPLNSHTSPDTPAPPRQTNVLITISGWMTYGKDDFTLPWSTLVQNIYGDQYALVWESKDLKELGSALKILASEIGSFLFQQGIQYTLLPVLMAGLTGPMWALKLTYLLDNPWGIGLSKAQRAGRVKLQRT